MEFKRLSSKEQNKYQDGGGFYEWIDERKKGLVLTSGIISLMTNEALFDTSTSDHYKQLVVLNRNDVHKRRIVELMMKEDFIFIEPNIDDNKILNTLSSGHGSFTTSPIYGVGVWETTSSTSTTSTTSPPVVVTAAAAGTSSQSSSISSDDQVHIIANNVYGINAGSLDELNQKYIQINRNKHKRSRN
jgi:hypothetical protein